MTEFNSINNIGVEQPGLNLLTTKSSDRRSDMFSGHVHYQYYRRQRLLKISCKGFYIFYFANFLFHNK